MTNIIGLMKKLSYPTNERGVCHGLAFMAERARICNQYDNFLERMNYLESLNENEIQELLSEAQRKSIAKLPLTANEEILLTVEAFFYGVWAHFSPSYIQQHLGLNDGPMWNQMEIDKLESFLFEHSEISPLPKPKSHFISGSLGTGGYSSLIDYLETVKNSDISCGLIFCSSIHTVHAFYDKEKNRWFLTNHSTLTDYESSESLAPAILSAFAALIPPGERGEFINLSASVFTNETAEKTNDFFQNLSTVSTKNLNSRIENKTAANPTSAGTPLMIAAMDGNLDTLRALLAMDPKIDVNYMDPKGETALQTAILYNRLEIVQELLNCSIEINKNLPLHLALRCKNSSIAKELLRHTDIDVNALDSEKTSPLLLAIRNKQFDIAKLLLGNPCVNVNAQDKYSVSPLIEAIRQGHLETVELLLRKKETGINWALFEAARSGNSEIVKTLLADARVKQNLYDTFNQHTKKTNPL